MKTYKDIKALTKDLTKMRSESGDSRDKVRVLTFTDAGMIDNAVELYYETQPGYNPIFLKSGKMSVSISKILTRMINSEMKIKLENITQTHY